ncbi:hypothetical protein Tco_0938941 [Tanacetum coccineum]|uniref:Uncharacterized protein n=1 Tax=Tanacetum coccineum TaxID=301880 RepID=A0ABQ5DLB7_9ASTR
MYFISTAEYVLHLSAEYLSNFSAEYVLTVIAEYVSNFTAEYVLTVSAEYVSNSTTKYFQKILNIFPRVQNQEFIVPPSNDSLMNFLLDLGYNGPLKHISECLLITCINHGEPLELLSRDSYQGRRQAMTDSDHQELKFSVVFTIRRMLIMLLWFGKIFNTRLTTCSKSSKDVRSCPIPGSPKPSYTTSYVNTNLFPRDKVRLTTQLTMIGRLRCKGVTKQIVGVVPKGLALRVVLVDLHSKDESGKGFKLEVN